MKGQDIFLQSDYDIFTKLTRSKQPYHCLSLGTDSIPIYNVEEYTNIKIKNRNRYLDNGKIKNAPWIHSKMISHGKYSSTSEIGLATSFHYDEDIVIVNTAKPPKQSKRSISNIVNDPLCILYKDSSLPRAISKKKHKGLLKLVKNKQMPQKYHSFYEDLNSTKRNQTLTLKMSRLHNYLFVFSLSYSYINLY